MNQTEWHQKLSAAPVDKRLSIFPVEGAIVGHPGILTENNQVICQLDIENFRIGKINPGKQLLFFRSIPSGKIHEWIHATVDQVDRTGEDIRFTYKVTKEDHSVMADPKAKSEVPQQTVKERQLIWARQKCKNNTWYVQDTAKRVPAFAAALAKWRAKQMTDTEFLNVAIEHLPCPDFSNEPINTSQRRNNGGIIQTRTQDGVGQGREHGKDDAGRPEQSKTRPNRPSNPTGLSAEADSDSPSKGF